MAILPEYEMGSLIVPSAPFGMQNPIYALCFKENIPYLNPGFYNIVFSHCRFISVSQIAALCMIKKVHPAGFNCISEDSGIYTYLSRMDYFRQIGEKKEEHFYRYSTNDEFPLLTKISMSGSQQSEVSTKLNDAFIKHLNISKSARNCLNQGR